MKLAPSSKFLAQTSREHMQSRTRQASFQGVKNKDPQPIRHTASYAAHPGNKSVMRGER